jgi:hypothetical protein
MGRNTLKPADPVISQYTIGPGLLRMRGADLPEITSVSIRDLIPSIPAPIFPSDQGLEAVRKAAKESLSHVDLRKIKEGDSVNILASHHGFTLLGGAPYAEILKITRDYIEEVSGTQDIRLRAGVGLRFRETEEYIQRFHLDDHFKGKAKGMAPVDEGIPIQTEFGTLYGLKRAYDAKWIVHAHNSDLRELHNHRQIDRILKPFAMSYARIETRSTYHQNFGPRSSNIIPRAVFNSDFVQSKFVFSIILTTSPNGIAGVDADNDLLKQNDRITIDAMRWYGKLLTLLREIKECIVVLDGPYPIGYMKAGGIVFDNFLGLSVDEFDLDHGWPPFSRYTEMFFDQEGAPFLKEIPPLNSAVKWIVNNYCFIGYPSTFFAQHVPTIVVGRPLADLINACPQNIQYMQYALMADRLEDAIKFAAKAVHTPNVLLFDGAIGGFNLTAPVADLLKSRAVTVEEEVERHLLPKWCRQRNLKLDGNRITKIV